MAPQGCRTFSIVEGHCGLNQTTLDEETSSITDILVMMYLGFKDERARGASTVNRRWGRCVDARRGASMGKGACGGPATWQCGAPQRHFVLGMGIVGFSLTMEGFETENEPRCSVTVWGEEKAFRHMDERPMGGFYSHRLSVHPKNASADMCLTGLAIGRILP